MGKVRGHVHALALRLGEAARPGPARRSRPVRGGPRVRRRPVAAAAARAVAGAFKNSCAGPGNLFREAKGGALLDDKATRQGVLDALAAARKQAKANDLMVVFFAGHGVKAKDQFFLLTAEASTNNLAQTALSGAELRKALAEFPCQVLLMLDACHAAAFGEKGKLARQGLKPATDDATRALTDDEVGVVVLCAAMGHEKAIERKGNGLFTKAVVEALTAPEAPCHPSSRRQYIHHLHGHVFDRVSEESEERQHPFLSLPWVVESFALRQLPPKSPGER